MFDIGHLLMQIIPISGAEIQGLTQSVVALTMSGTAIAAIVVKFIQTHSNNQKIKSWADTVSKDLAATKQSLQATDQWVLENQAKFTSGMTVVNQLLTPEQQKALAAQGVNIENLKNELDEVTKEITSIYSTAPSSEAAKTKVGAVGI